VLFGLVVLEVVATYSHEHHIISATLVVVHERDQRDCNRCGRRGRKFGPGSLVPIQSPMMASVVAPVCMVSEDRNRYSVGQQRL